MKPGKITKTRRFVLVTTASILLLTTVPAIGFAGSNQSSISVVINERKQQYDQSPVLLNGSVMVPLRSVFQSLEANVTYDSKTRTIKSNKGEISVSLQVGSKIAKVNGKEVTLSQPATSINNSTYVPIRFVSEALGAEVKWDSKNNIVFITYKENPEHLSKLVEAELLNNQIDVEKVASLIRKGADANRALFFAIDHGAPLEVGQAIVKCGANPSILLISNVTSRDITTVKMQLALGADPNVQDTTGNFFSPLTSALNKWTVNGKKVDISFELAEILLEAGAKPTPEDLANILIYRNSDALKLLLDHGADPNGIVTKIVYRGTNSTSFYFFGDAPDPNVKQKVILQAIDQAIATGESEFKDDVFRNVELLLKYGASLDTVSQDQLDQLLQLALKLGVDSPYLLNALRTAGAK
ncbi:stalk domain-containing protein [Gorillibacterium timonense]|uniref:stalk domain-containing protein n=1 Tax=Gorillibacterium timonense TaxID=1689269 RepID=UPI00071E0E9B|nr:stalk domain-containing protein [Gorillibacterium timonense]